MARLKKGSAAAKAFMAKIRSKRKGGKKSTRRKVGAVKLIERGEAKNVKPKRIVRIVRSKKGRFKGVRNVSGISTIAGHKSAIKGSYLDQLGKLETKKFLEKTKRGKTKIGKQIADVKKQIRKYL